MATPILVEDDTSLVLYKPTLRERAVESIERILFTVT